MVGEQVTDAFPPSVMVFPAFGGYAVVLGEGLHVTSDLDHVLRLIDAYLRDIDRIDAAPVEEAMKKRRWWR